MTLSRRAADSLAAALLVLLNVVLYRKVLRLWWTYDDPNILRLMWDFPFWQTFTNGRVWPQQLFTPLMITAFEGQLALWGLNTTAWYATHLGIACVTTLLVYATVRQFLGVTRALAACATFAAGVPLVSVVTQLSTVHYFIAISFCAFAVIFYVRGWFALSAVAYLLAMLAKEVAVPLPILLACLECGGKATAFQGAGRAAALRTRRLIGHGVALVVYFAWRYAVLGTFLGAYGWKIDAAEWPRLLTLLPWRIIKAAAGVNLAIGLTLVAIVLIVIAFGARRHLLLLLAAMVVVFGPMLPLAKEVNRRYVVVPWLASSIAFAAAVPLRNRRLAVVLLTGVPLLTIAANRQEWGTEFGLRQRMSDEARTFFELPQNGLLRNPAPPPAVMGELNWIKTEHLKQPPGAAWFYDDIFLCAGGADGKRVWEFDAKTRAVVEVTPRMEAVRAKHCSSMREDKPLDVAFHFRKPALYWDLGPYDTGRYSAVIGNGVQAFEIPRRDALNLPGATGVSLRIRYDSPEGWTTYSPELAVDFISHPDVVWRRGGGKPETRN